MGQASTTEERELEVPKKITVHTHERSHSRDILCDYFHEPISPPSGIKIWGAQGLEYSDFCNAARYLIEHWSSETQGSFRRGTPDRAVIESLTKVDFGKDFAKYEGHVWFWKEGLVMEMHVLPDKWSSLGRKRFAFQTHFG